MLRALREEGSCLDAAENRGKLLQSGREHVDIAAK